MWSKALVAVILAAVLPLFHQVVWIPWHCNQIKGDVQRATAELEEQSNRVDTNERANRNSETLASCLRWRPRDVELLLLAGANLYLAGRFEAAGSLYCTSLEYDRRPELYLGCGNLQLLSGDRAVALETYVRAGEFAGLGFLSRIPDGRMRYEAYRIVGSRIERNLAARGELHTPDLVQNGGFSGSEWLGAAEATSDGEAPAPADHWSIVNRERGTTSVAVIQSARRPGGRSLQISSTTAESGIVQWFVAVNRRPRVFASAWVYVTRGTICLGSGNGGRPLINVCSEATGRWEKLEAMSETCPATMVTLISGTAEGADFIVDEVRARTSYTAPCDRE
jgi:hypothetical protein